MARRPDASLSASAMRHRVVLIVEMIRVGANEAQMMAMCSGLDQAYSVSRCTSVGRWDTSGGVLPPRDRAIEHRRQLARRQHRRRVPTGNPHTSLGGQQATQVSPALIA